MVKINLDEFLEKKNIIAVVGVSIDKKKWGSQVYRALKPLNFTAVYPVNPKYKKIDADICYSTLSALPKKPDVVITIVQPKITEQIVKKCKKLGINKVWMQPGSESKKAINFCEDNKIQTIHDLCFVINGLKEKFDK